MKIGKVLGLVVLTFLLISATVATIQIEKKSFFKGKVELSIPKGFELMSEEDRVMKYPHEKRPPIVYTNETQSVNVTLSLSESNADQSKIPTYKTLFSKYLIAKYPNGELKESGVKEINGRKVGYTEFTFNSPDTTGYNLMFFTDVDGKLLVSTFNCVIDSVEEWTPTAKKIMNSLKVK